MSEADWIELTKLVRVRGAEPSQVARLEVEVEGTEGNLARALLAEIAVDRGQFELARGWLEGGETSVNGALVRITIARLEGRLADATDHAEQVLRETAPSDETRARALIELADCCIATGQLDRADCVLTEAEADGRLPAWLQIRTRLHRARLLSERESLTSARAELQAALASAQALGARRESLTGLCLLAALELDLDLEAAARNAEQAEQLAVELDHPLARAAALRTKALAVRRRVGEGELADRLRTTAFETLAALGQTPLDIEIDRALDVRRFMPAELRIELLRRLEQLELSLDNVEHRALLCKDMPDAATRLQELLAWAESVGVPRREAAVRRSLAAVLFNQGVHGASLEQARRALALAEVLHDRNGIARAHALLLLNTRMVDRDQREQHLDRALTEARVLGDRQLQAVVLTDAARILVEEGALDKPRRLVLEARTHATVVEDLWRLGISEGILGMVTTSRAEQRARYRTARAMFEQFGLVRREIDAIVRLRVPWRTWAIIGVVVYLGYLVYLIAR